MAKITVDNFGDEISKMLIEYGQECVDTLSFASKETAKEAAKTLREISPKRTGDYAKDWTYRLAYKSRTGASYTVYNKEHYQLTHLLEFGHAKSGGTDTTKAIPHISKVDEMLPELMIKNFEKRL